jgi:hypothetical protein
MKILNNIDLTQTGLTRPDWGSDGWETCAAAAFDTVVFTGNWFAAYSIDGGVTFLDLDPQAVCQAWGEDFCCDQIVVYIPRINAYVWVLQTDPGNLVLATASPADLHRPNGPRWDTLLIRASTLGGAQKVDRSELGYGDNYLYLTSDLIGSGRVCLRIPLAVIYRGGLLEGLPGAQYFLPDPDTFLYPCSDSGSVGRFVSLVSQTTIRVWEWSEIDDGITYFDVDLMTSIPDANFATTLPTGAEWLDINSKIDWNKCSAAVTRNRLWVVWPGGRGYSADSAKVGFPFPHVGVAEIDIANRTLVNQTAVWHPEFGISWPAVAANVAGEIGLSACIGGGTQDAQHIVLLLTDPKPWVWYETTKGKTVGAGGHYVSIREHHPNVLTFAASGFNQVIDSTGNKVHHPHYIVFRSG